MDLRHLRTFIAVAEERSFRRAAERLHLSQPPLSRQIRALEEDLGVRLLERGRSRRVALTEAGQSYLGDARRLLAAVAAARDGAREAARGTRGLLRLANTAELSTPVLTPLLHAFRETFPQVKVSLLEIVWPEQLKALDEERVHAVISPNIGQSFGRRFQSQPLISSPMVVVLPPGHPLARRRRTALDIKKLEGQTLLTLSPETRPGYVKMLEALCVAMDFTPTETHAVDKAENLLGMVAAGYGVAILPELVSRAAMPACYVRPLRSPAFPFRLTLVWRRDATSPLLHNFLAVTKRWTDARDENPGAR